jgi:hypothetical protein
MFSKYCILLWFVYRFEEATEILTRLVNALITKRWDEAQVYGQDARERFRALLNDSVVKWVCVCIKITVTVDLTTSVV